MSSPARQTAPPSERPRVAVVGNAPPAKAARGLGREADNSQASPATCDGAVGHAAPETARDGAAEAAAIDACDVVVRINRAPGFGGARGRRVDVLVLVNCGGQMREWLETGEIFAAPVFAAAATVVLPIHPGKARLIAPPLDAAELAGAAAQDHTDAAASRIEAAGKAVVVPPPEDFAEAMAELGHAPLRRNSPAPSTGYLATRWWVRRGTHAVHAFGFGFAGWDGHDFAAERRWFERAVAAGRLVVHPPAMAEASARRWA